jgi:hypothetical protein
MNFIRQSKQEAIQIPMKIALVLLGVVVAVFVIVSTVLEVLS